MKWFKLTLMGDALLYAALVVCLATGVGGVLSLNEKLRRQEQEASDLREATIEVMQRAKVVLDRHDRQFGEQDKINKTTHRLLELNDQRIESLERANNIPPQRLPVTPKEQDEDEMDGR